MAGRPAEVSKVAISLLRSRIGWEPLADLVRQEFYGWVLMHYVVRWLLHQGAASHRIPHEDLSFKEHVELVEREQPLTGAFPPGQPRKRARWMAGLLETSATLRASRTIDRSSPRMVERRHSRNKAFDWGASRRVPIDPRPQPAPPMQNAPPGRTRKRRAWSPGNPRGKFVL
ncbi:MAG: hypothetical protein HYZ20_02365 [Burkholderiales bacterium]|nr:hypothetical protein [Burkholderiales bacterium]